MVGAELVEAAASPDMMIWSAARAYSTDLGLSEAKVEGGLSMKTVC
jgi:hypothetical protein